jgi:hypothetical protein
MLMKKAAEKAHLLQKKREMGHIKFYSSRTWATRRDEKLGDRLGRGAAYVNRPPSRTALLLRV